MLRATRCSVTSSAATLSPPTSASSGPATTSRTLGGHAAAARLIIFGREQFTSELRERSAAEGIHLVSAAQLFQAS